MARSAFGALSDRSQRPVAGPSIARWHASADARGVRSRRRKVVPARPRAELASPLLLFRCQTQTILFSRIAQVGNEHVLPIRGPRRGELGARATGSASEAASTSAPSVLARLPASQDTGRRPAKRVGIGRLCPTIPVAGGHGNPLRVSIRIAGRVGTRMPSVPWTRTARPLACGCRGSLPGKPAADERRSPGCLVFQARLTPPGEKDALPPAEGRQHAG